MSRAIGLSFYVLKIVVWASMVGCAGAPIVEPMPDLEVEEPGVEKGEEEFRDPCDAGEEDCGELGAYLWDGTPLPESLEEAIPVLLASCDEGENGQACYLLASLHVLGRGVSEDREEARRRYEQGCERDVGLACFALGWMLYYGQGGEAEVHRARLIWMRGCDLGSGEACRQVGGLYYFGRGVDMRPDLAATYLFRGCVGGSGEACVEVDEHFGIDVEDREDQVRLADVIETACERESSMGCVMLGAMIEDGQGRARDLQQAMANYRRACESGEYYGCTLMAMLYERGEGSIPTRRQRAVELYEEACQTGNREACTAMGVLYLRGRAVARDGERAVEYFSRSCEMGQGRGCFNLGLMYESGRRVEEDQERAAIYHRIGCDMGFGPSCNSLAFHYDEGGGVEVDRMEAFEIFERSCALGYGKGCFNVAVSYEEGDPVEADFGAAMEFYEKACAGGYRMGCNNLGFYNMEEAVSGGDVRDALRALEQACEDGELPRACARAGEILLDDPRIPTSPLRARRNLKAACDNGEPRGCLFLGFTYERGQGVEADRERALQTYAKSCALGQVHACGRRGWLMLDDRDTREQGKIELRRACEEGDDWACERAE